MGHSTPLSQALKAAEEARKQKEQQKELLKEQQLKDFRERVCTVEQMCQGLATHHMDWEERA